MKNAMTANTAQTQALKPRNRRIRLSAKCLLAAGALMTASTAQAQVNISTISDLASFLNTDEDIMFQNDLDLLGGTFNVTKRTQFFGDGGTRTISNGTINVLGSTSETNYVLFNLTPTVIFTGDVVLPDFARLDLDAPSVLGVGGSVDADDDTDIRLFTGAAGTNTWDTTFFAKISGVGDSTSISIVGDGESILTALPTFDALINLNQYSDFDDFAVTPAVDPTLSLGATLAGNHAVTINVGTLNLANFDFTIDSLTGEADTEVTLGSGTLTTGDGVSTTYAGVISGTGNLVKTGTGTFTLSGINTYTGMTTVSGGILRLEADQTGPTAVTVQNGATLLVNAVQTGVPTYTVENGGIVNLNADIADTTPFTIDTGGLVNLLLTDQTFASIAGGGTIDLGFADLVSGDATDTTFSGVITGDGSFTKAGTGILTLSGANTFTGSTTLSAGTITLDGSLANTTGVTLAAGTLLTLNGDINDAASVAIGAGATLDLNNNDETLATITGTGTSNITLDNATLTVGNGSSFTFGGVISESGNLIKQGTGTMTLSAAQAYTGSTAINAGTLIANGDLATSGVTVGSGATFNLESTLTTASADVTVDAGGTLFGTGTIPDDLINNGTVTFLGPGLLDTLTVNGDYTQGSTGLLEIQIGNAGGLVVAGTANLDGTLDIGIPLDPSTFDIGATYDVLTAGTLAGNFSNVTDDFIFLDLTSTIAATDVEITLARNATALASIARTNNHTTIANVLDGLGAPTGNLDSMLDRILASSEEGALAAYEDLAGAGAATASTQIAAAAVGQSHRVLDQASGVSPATSRPKGSFSQANSPDFDETDHFTLLSFYQGTVEEEPQSEEGLFGSLQPTAWGSIYGGFGDQGDGAEGLDYNRYGMLVGLELESDETGATYGLSLGVEQSDFEFNQDNGDVDIESIYLSGYTRMPFGNNYHVTLTGAGGYHNHDSTRNILIGVTPTQAKADFDSFSLSLAGEISKTFDVVRTPVDPGGHPTLTSIEPFARLDYSISDQDGYSETGAGTAGLVVASSEYDSVRAAFGVRVQHQYMFLNQHEATFQARALVNTAISNSDSGLNVAFVGAPGTSFEIEGSDQDDIFGQIGFGLSVQINNNWDIHFDIDQQFSSDAMGTLVVGGLSYSF